MLILVDTKEKYPWNFEIFGHTQKHVHLETGDYTIESPSIILI